MCLEVTSSRFYVIFHWSANCSLVANPKILVNNVIWIEVIHKADEHGIGSSCLLIHKIRRLHKIPTNGPNGVTNSEIFPNSTWA
jgi:hypothetical protein